MFTNVYFVIFLHFFDLSLLYLTSLFATSFGDVQFEYENGMTDTENNLYVLPVLL